MIDSEKTIKLQSSKVGIHAMQNGSASLLLPSLRFELLNRVCFDQVTMTFIISKSVQETTVTSNVIMGKGFFVLTLEQLEVLRELSNSFKANFSRRVTAPSIFWTLSVRLKRIAGFA
jgi:hypothetical protein